MNSRGEIIPFDGLLQWRAQFRTTGQRLVVTNGCFDLLHAGHINYLETARREGDALLVGLNGDDSVRQLKGANRPINTEDDRAVLLASLRTVDAVSIFAEKTATRFLERAAPDIYIKGGDYTLETLNQDERRAVEKGGGRIVIVQFVAGKSTTGLVEKLRKL